MSASYVHLGRWSILKDHILKKKFYHSGVQKIEYTLAKDGALKLWGLLHEDEAVRCLGVLTGNQAVQQVEGRSKSYLSFLVGKLLLMQILQEICIQISRFIQQTLFQLLLKRLIKLSKE